MIVIGIHFCLFSVALCLKGDNVCDVRISRCVYLFIYLFILEIIGLYEILTWVSLFSLKRKLIPNDIRYVDVEVLYFDVV